MGFRIRSLAFVCFGSLIAACGSQTPTRPAPLSLTATTSFPEDAPAVVRWSCLTQTASNPGIFASGVIDAACPARLTIQGWVFAAAAAPGPPPNLTGSVNGSTVTLTWLVPTSSDPATSYVIEAGSSAGSANIAVFDTLSTATSFTANGVPAGTYYVRVRARNSAGTSSASNEVVLLVGGGGCTNAPGPPSGLTSSVSGSSVTLSWTGPVGGCAPTGYVLEAGSSTGSSNLANFNTGSTATTFSDGGVPNGTYLVRVRAANGIGHSDPSNEITVVVGGPALATLTGRWIGLVASGDGATLTSSACGVEKADWQLDLTQTGSAVSGRLTTTTVMSGCDPAGLVRTGTIDGTTGSGTFSFTLSNNSSRTGTATFTASRMTGSTTFAGTFAVNKQ